jgi:hypothetical protein
MATMAFFAKQLNSKNVILCKTIEWPQCQFFVENQLNGKNAIFCKTIERQKHHFMQNN